jgi:dipeptidyl aminopeptidase/acylaminoacyl peptidase
VGEPQDTYRMGIVRIDPTVAPDDVKLVWLSLAEAEDRETVPWGPFWDPESDRAVVQIISADSKDRWIGDLDLENGSLDVIFHDHEEEWLGGPPVQPNYILPGLLEWIPGGGLVIASERDGWSHLWIVEQDGTIRALTSGAWEVRDAVLTRDRSRWLITASREHPSDDHLYSLPAAGSDLDRLTDGEGRNNGVPSPGGERLAVVSSDVLHLPDLHLRDFKPQSESVRVTVSGSDRYYRHPLARPEIVSFPHTDGRPLWAALFKPEKPNPERAAVLHIHGGGYRQFSHRGWSVYGYALHLAGINYLVQQGYTVLDFDYRGSAGFGRRYRTDIYRSMGVKDFDVMVYPTERHTIETEASRYDYMKRLTGFFDEHLLRR